MWTVKAAAGGLSYFATKAQAVAVSSPGDAVAERCDSCATGPVAVRLLHKVQCQPCARSERARDAYEATHGC